MNGDRFDSRSSSCDAKRFSARHGANTGPISQLNSSYNEGNHNGQLVSSSDSVRFVVSDSDAGFVMAFVVVIAVVGVFAPGNDDDVIITGIAVVVAIS